MLAELSSLQWDCVCFSETRAAKDDMTLLGGHRLIAHRSSTYGGVAILVHANLVNNISSSQEFGDRVLALRLYIQGVKFTTIAVYTPHAGYPEVTLCAFYESYRAALDWAMTFSRPFFVGGDFNTHWRIGYRGELLGGACDEYDLTIANNLSVLHGTTLGRFKALWA